jgi:hypothetical protein
MRGIEFEPTDADRRTVKAQAGLGVRQDDIARGLNIDAKTLRKHFRDELDRGSVKATAKVAETLYKMATSGTNTAATIFWMKAQGKWVEKNHVEVSGPDGAPLQIQQVRRVIVDPKAPGD